MSELLQQILTYSIIAAAVIYALIGVYKSVRPNKHDIPGCGGSCGCDASEVKKKWMETHPGN